jgi:hypothetical protein
MVYMNYQVINQGNGYAIILNKYSYDGTIIDVILVNTYITKSCAAYYCNQYNNNLLYNGIEASYDL